MVSCVSVCGVLCQCLWCPVSVSVVPCVFGVSVMFLVSFHFHLSECISVVSVYCENEELRNHCQL